MHCARVACGMRQQSAALYELVSAMCPGLERVAKCLLPAIEEILGHRR